MKILIAAGGTGGHLFPAIAVAEQIKKIVPDAEFIFCGRVDKIAGQIIPKLNHGFFPIDIAGITKLMSIKTMLLPLKIFRAIASVSRLIKTKKIDFVICTGAYISYAPGIAAKRNKIPLFLMESNVNPGKTISLLSGSADLIFTSFEESKNYFKKDIKKKIRFVGNPLRQSFEEIPDRISAINKFQLENEKKTILIFGGSLGARSINQAVEGNINEFKNLNLNIIWQTGTKYQAPDISNGNIKILPFIDDMASAYAAADLVICRSGATSAAELALTAKPSLLIPLPSASNNEQFMNALIFEENKASVLINDKDLKSKLLDFVKQIIFDNNSLTEMSKNAAKLAKPSAAKDAAIEIINFMKHHGK
jgi:UDP-N-acetylglucosamine--N-acetylmuramyl-(pentapeptide) pyrophosphoryl-undecaprenol N-acetylglucosamine transferase